MERKGCKKIGEVENKEILACEKKEKVLVMVDVWNCQARAFLQKENIIVPTNEMERIVYYESGEPHPEIIGEDIYDKLSKTDQKRVDKVAEPINISGIRGTLEVEL